MDKTVESITKHHFNRGGRQPSAGAKKSGTFRSQPNNKPVNSTNNTAQCSNCIMTHIKNQCPVYQVTCFNCNRIGHYASVCRSSSSNSTQNTRQFTRFHGRGRTPHGERVILRLEGRYGGVSPLGVITVLKYVITTF